MIKMIINYKKIIVFVTISLLFCLNLCPKEYKKPIRVYVSMVAYLFHYGHVAFLKQAKEFGDYLIVGIISDEEVTPYKRKPILTQEERIKTISGCRYG